MTKVVIVSGIQIINNPRVVKEADALAGAGYEVEVIGAVFDPDSATRINRLLKHAKWKHIPVIDLSDGRTSAKALFIAARIKRKFWLLAKKWFQIESHRQLGYFVSRLHRLARSREADLYIVHLEQALWVGKRLVEAGKTVAIDVEDWYSEDGLPEDRALRPIQLMKACERYLLNRTVYSSTTSESLAKGLAEEYQCPLPAVVYNSFPSDEKGKIDGKFLDRRNRDIPSITWFSQTVGPGRGLEELVEALDEIDYPFELHIRGTPRRGYVDSLLANRTAATLSSIHFHPQVPQDELLSRLSEHDIGYCGELSDCRSRDLTITNKVLEYLRAGLAVVASNTSGHREVASLQLEGVFIYEQENPESLRSILEYLVINRPWLSNSIYSGKSGLVEQLSWERSEKVLAQLCKTSLNTSVEQNANVAEA